MNQIIISFRSRNDIFNFSRLLQKNGVFNSVINTPSSIGSTCSLSIRCEYRQLPIVNRILKAHRFNSFVGVYLIAHTSVGERISRLL